MLPSFVLGIIVQICKFYQKCSLYLKIYNFGNFVQMDNPNETKRILHSIPKVHQIINSSPQQQQQQVDKYPNLIADLPTLPEGRLFEPNLQIDLSGEEDNDASGTDENTSVSSVRNRKLNRNENQGITPTGGRTRWKRKCLESCTPPYWLRHAANQVYRRTGGVATYLVFFLLIYTLLWILTGDEALPPRCYAYQKEEKIGGASKKEVVAVCYGGTTIAVVIFYAVAFAMGQLVELVRLPGLLGEFYLF